MLIYCLDPDVVKESLSLPAARKLITAKAVLEGQKPAAGNVLLCVESCFILAKSCRMHIYRKYYSF